MEIISTLILATWIYGAEGASIDRIALQALDTLALNAMWGEKQSTRAKEIILRVLLPATEDLGRMGKG